MKISAPRRATRSASFAVRGGADRVFPLFCPVREREWLESWNPGVVYSQSGLAEPECVFTSADRNGDTIWVVAHHDPHARVVKMVRVTPGFTACVLDISVVPVSSSECEVAVTYSHTALSEAGEIFVDAYSDEAYRKMMAHWQTALDFYLAHGSPLPGS
jgi:hypothetical protein